MIGLIDLREIGPDDLEPLLRDETEEWRRELDWDFKGNASLVRKFAGLRALGGSALMDGSDVAGYGYTVVEDHKALIGDLYVRPCWRDGGTEGRLFRALLDEMMHMSQVRRVDTQLMLANPETGRLLQRERFARLFERMLMTRDLPEPLPQGK